MDGDVIIPELQPVVVPELEKTEEAQQIEKEQLVEERLLGSVSYTSGWGKLVEIIDKDIKEHGDITQFINFSGGGVNELAADVRARAFIVEYLRKFKQRVEHAAQASEGTDSL